MRVLLGIVGLVFSLNSIAALEIVKSESEDDLARYDVIDPENRFSYQIYFEQSLAKAAYEAIPILNEIYLDLSSNVGLKPSDIKWAEVAFVTSDDYIPPRKNGLARWSVVQSGEDKLSKISIKELYVFIAHEQTHSIQHVLTCDSPRWFDEGQAMWNELKVTKDWNEDSAEKVRLKYQTAFEKLEGDVNLKGWGGITVKREAIERQVSPEVLKKMKEDPTYAPPGPFSFGPDDFISDESNSKARYFASLQIFEYLEGELGSVRLKKMFNDIGQMESCKTDELLELIKNKYQINLFHFF